MSPGARVVRLVTVSGGVLTAIAVLLPPLVYLYSSAERMAGSLEAEAELNAVAIGRIVAENPDLWRYEQVRLAEFLARRPRQGDPEIRRVRDREGRLVAESVDPLASPRISRGVPLRDAGVPVGRIEIERSLRPTLLRALFIGLALLPLGALAFLTLRQVPLRTIAAAEEALRLQLTRQRALEDRLLQAEKLEAVGRLAGGVAHEFNNSLSIIKVYGASLRRELAADDPHRADVEEIAAAADRAASVARDLLAFSRRQELEAAPVDLVDLVGSAERLMRPALRGGARLDLALAPGPLPVLADRLQLERVLVHLVVNSCEAMGGPGRIAVSVAREWLDEVQARAAGLEGPGAFARIDVADDGPGIDEAAQLHLFEPFFTTKVVGQGAGLGLSFAYGVLAQHRGAIAVASERGRGATFTIRLPLLEAR